MRFGSADWGATIPGILCQHFPYCVGIRGEIGQVTTCGCIAITASMAKKSMAAWRVDALAKSGNRGRASGAAPAGIFRVAVAWFEIEERLAALQRLDALSNELPDDGNEDGPARADLDVQAPQAAGADCRPKR